MSDTQFVQFRELIVLRSRVCHLRPSSLNFHQKNNFVAVGDCWLSKLSFSTAVAATTIASTQAAQHPPDQAAERRDTPPGSNLHGTAGQDQHMADTAATRVYSHVALTLDKIDDYFGHFSKRQIRPCPIFADFRENASKMRPPKISAPAAGDAVAPDFTVSLDAGIAVNRRGSVSSFDLC